MSCSKIFSGDLPELTYDIIKCFQNDFSTLHSCILVNRFWCRLAIPLLWENPFSIRTGNYNFIEIYSVNLKSEFKTKLIEYKIINDSLPSNTLFNYPSFLKYLNIREFILFVVKKFETNIKNTESDIKKLVDTIYKSLFIIFIENEVNLNTLEIDITGHYYRNHFESILELILQNPNFIHNIKNLNLYSFNEYTENIDHTLQIIDLHQNLKKIFIGFSSSLLYQLFLSSKDYYNCSNTLNTIIFFRIDFRVINNLKEIFELLNVLESTHIYECHSLNTDFTQQIINLTKPFKLKSLFISNNSRIDESLQLLLQKSGDYLENFGYDSRFILDKLLILFKQQLLELILKYCKNIKYLDFYGFENHIIYSTLNLIENIKQNLNYLTIHVSHNSKLSIRIEHSAIILRNLGQTLPLKLEYLNFDLCIKSSDMEVFLKNSQNTFIKKLLMTYSQGSDDIDILSYIKEYIMKEKRVEYLAIKSSFFRNGEEDLYYLKDEVEEFKLHDIKVRRYLDLLIKISTYDFVMKIDKFHYL